ncbi:MAG: hypothetical protein EPN82_02375 [Bacteroidetes bacterium]|nr:MAG: hypothetical protein EPN82_02375 [Bacteroidota bacterium]
MKLILLLLFILLFLSCSNSSDSDETVKVPEIVVSGTNIKAGDTVMVSVKTAGINNLKYHWSVSLGNTGYSSAIIESEFNNSFNGGTWIKLCPKSSGEWEIELLAYLPAGDHSYEGSGGRRVYYWDDGIHCFLGSEYKKYWNKNTKIVIVSE